MAGQTATAGIGSPLDLEAFLAREVDRVERALGELARGLATSTPAALREPMLYALGTRGKRIRPILCVGAYRALRGEATDAVYRLGCGLEIVHTYSLVHDDLPCMDDDDLRRGRPTVHRVFGVHAGLLAGAALLPVAVLAAERAGAELGLDVQTRGRLVAELCGAAGAGGMVGGQYLDLEAEHRPVDGEELERIHRAKTGALLSASLRVGALAAGADAGPLEALTRYGSALGLAFQIADDILDVTQDSRELGKTAGKDESVGKATYPGLFGLQRARELARQRADEAISALRGGGIDAPVLEALADYVVERRR